MSWFAIVGTRPEAIKLAPVLLAARVRGLPMGIVLTGQHPALASDALAAFDLVPDVALPALPVGDLTETLGGIVIQVGAFLRERPCHGVIVHGDTTSALGAALAAKAQRRRVAHVEAGLRTGDDRAPFPEELYRRTIDAIADRCFAPTPRARDALLREGIDPEKITVTGNPIVDAVRRMLGEHPDRPPGPHVLVTVHRRENLVDLEEICMAVARIARPNHPVVWPVHPNPAVAGIVYRSLGESPHVDLISPLPYRDLLLRLASAALVLTDSGGLQEEAACLGRPTLVLRQATERPEVLETGVIAVVGTDVQRIVTAAEAWLADPPTRSRGPFALGDGEAGARIAEGLADDVG